MHKHELIPKLERMAMFEDFKRDETTLLAAYLVGQRVEQGAIIFREGERTAHMCLLLEGRLEVLKDAQSGQTKKLADIAPGKFIGEISVVDGQPYSATVIAAESSVLVLLSRENLMRICEERPRIGNKLLFKIANMLSQRLRQTTGKLIDHL